MIVGLEPVAVDEGMLRLRQFLDGLEALRHAQPGVVKIGDRATGTEEPEEDKENICGMVSGEGPPLSFVGVSLNDAQAVMGEFMSLATGVEPTTNIDGEFARVCEVLAADGGWSSTEEKAFRVHYEVWKTGRQVREAMVDSQESLRAVIAAGEEARRAAYRAFMAEGDGGLKDLEAADADLDARMSELRVNVHLQSIANQNIIDCLKDESLWEGEGEGEGEKGEE